MCVCVLLECIYSLSFVAQWTGLIPIPVRNTIMKLMTDPHKGLILVYIAKSEELTMAKVKIRLGFSD